jgi:hypothetical protein
VRTGVSEGGLQTDAPETIHLAAGAAASLVTCQACAGNRAKLLDDVVDHALYTTRCRRG